MGFFRPFVHLFKIIKYHGGIVKLIEQYSHVDDGKIGFYVGQDRFGNRYYENNYYFFPGNRWVIYSEKVGYDYDGSQVCCGYFNWLHHITDKSPDGDSSDAAQTTHKWQLPHTENPTGTKLEYVPYSTVKPKIHVWKSTSVLHKCPKYEQSPQ